MKRALTAAFVLAIAPPGAAHAFCTLPSIVLHEPSPPIKPEKPFCVAVKTCTQWDVDNYRRDMADYVASLKRYVQEAQDAGNRYAEDALEYAKCQLRND